MTRIDTTRLGVLKVRGAGEDAESPALRFTLATNYEEPDLKFDASEGYLREWLFKDAPLTLERMRRENLLEVDGTKGIAIAETAIASGSGEQRYFAVFCSVALRDVPELNDEVTVAALGAPNLEYVEMLRSNDAQPDPLVLAQGGMRPEGLKLLGEAGTEAVKEEFPEGGYIAIRVVTNGKEIRALQKLFAGGLLSSLPQPLLLDGPLRLQSWRLRNGHETGFACLVPVGHQASDLVLNELLLSKAAKPESDTEDDPLADFEAELEAEAAALETANEKSDAESVEAESEQTRGDLVLRYVNERGRRVIDNPPIQLGEESGLRLQRYYYSDDPSREYASEEWGEDLRIEGEVADVSALLVRDFMEFNIVVGERSHEPRAIEALYLPNALKPGLDRVIPTYQNRAAKEFLTDKGQAAIWTPRREGADMTGRILRRPPSLQTRRAMVSFLPYVPLGYVIQIGV